MRLLAASLLSLSLLGVHSESYTEMVDRVTSSIVRITSSDGSCTGFVIETHLVLTADHCLGEDMEADKQPATVVSADEGTDLLLLFVPTLAKPALAFEDVPVTRFEMLTAIGYGFGWTQPTVIRATVMLVSQAPDEGVAPGIVVQGGYIHGMSGGPVVDDNGKVVSIAQQVSEGTGYGVDTKQIKAFLLKAR